MPRLHSFPGRKVKLKPDVSYTMMISGSEVATAHVEIDVPGCYQVYIDGEEISTVDEEGLGCEAYTGTWTVVLKPSTSGGSGSAGDGGASGVSSFGGMGGSFSLGGSANGSAGEISFSSGTISPDLFTSGALNYVSVSADIEEIRDIATNALRQIKAPEALADIVTLSATSYEIRFYPISQVGAKVSGLYQTTGRLSSETDEQGITTTFDIYDAEDRVTQETRAGIITTRIYDPLGRITSTTRSAGGLSLSTATTYDLSGRMKSETDENGFVTNLAYTNGGRITTRTRPDTATEITILYLDGQTSSITGTGVVARFYNYGTDANGLWSKESIASETSLRHATSWKNLDGQTWRTATNRQSGLIVTQTEFDLYTERVTSKTVPGEAPILFAYDDDTGALIRQARDLNGNGVIDLAGPYSIQETRTSYVEVSGSWFRETVNSIYQADDSPTATTLATSREKLTALGVETASVTESIDSQGHVTTRTLAINRATRTVTTTTDIPDSSLNAVAIAVDGLTVSSTTPTVATPTQYDHDALGRLETVTSPRGVITTTVYHPTTGRVSSKIHAGKTTQYTYHPSGSPGAGMVATETRPDTSVIRTSYTLRGEVFRIWGGGTYPLEYSYNSHGQIETLKTYRNDADWTAATWPTHPGTGDLTTWTYFPESGQLHQKTDAANKAETLTYHPHGKLHTRQRATGKTITYTWTNRGQPESITYSDATPAVHHTYDRVGRFKTTKDAAGTRTFTYSDLLTTTESISDGILAGVTRTSTLDTYSRHSQSTAVSGSALHDIAYQYSPVSRLDQVVAGTHSATYGYLANSDALETVIFKSGATTRLTTTRSNDTSDRLNGVTNSYDSQSQSFGVSEFDEMNRRKKITREDGTRWNYGYNPKGEVESGIREKTVSPHTPVPGWNHAYTFDQIGNRNTATTNGRLSTYTPNDLNQYNSRTIPRAFDIIGKAATTASVTVDGNPTTRLDEFFYKELAAGSGPVHTPYVVQATDANGTTTRSGGKFLPATPENFTYDFDGNLTSDGRFVCTWDAENRHIAMETHPGVPLPARCKLVFAYDAMHRRIKKDVWHGTSSGGWQLRHKFDFIHELNRWNILAEKSGGSTNSFLRTYTWGTDLSGNLSGAAGVGGLLFVTLHTSGKNFAYGSDLNGNVTLLVDTATGQSAATYDYGPFGEPIRQSGEYALLNPYRFSTKYTDDETGWLDYGMRYYIPALGRWPSRDPIQERGGINLYLMVKNSSINSIDSTGLSVFMFTEEGSTSPDVVSDLNQTIRDARKQVKAELEKAKAQGKTDRLSYAWFDHNGKEEKLGKGKEAEAEFIKRMDREEFIEVEVEGHSLKGDLQRIMEGADKIKYPYDVVVYSKHGDVFGGLVPYKDKSSHTLDRVGYHFELALQALPVQKGVLVICQPKQSARYELKWPHPSITRIIQNYFTPKASKCDFEFYAGDANKKR
jgi:RHS repeat-associated protein